MRGKFLFGSGLIIGYVFGTRAGRKRYEQMKTLAQSVWNTAPVQHSVDAAKDFALTYTGDVAETALDAVKKLVRIATQSAARAERVAHDTVDEVVEVVAPTAKSPGERKPAAKKSSGASASAAKPKKASE